MQLRFGKSMESQHVRTRIGNLKFIFISRIKPSEVFLIILFSDFAAYLIFAKIESFPSQFPRKEILRHFDPKILKLIRSYVYEEILVGIRSLEDLIEWIRTGSFIQLHRDLLVILQVPVDQIEVSRVHLAIHDLQLVLPLHFENLSNESWLSEADFD